MTAWPCVLGLVGPAAYAIDTMQTAFSGGDPSAGPVVEGTRGRVRGGPATGDGNGGPRPRPGGGTLPLPYGRPCGCWTRRDRHVGEEQAERTRRTFAVDAGPDRLPRADRGWRSGRWRPKTAQPGRRTSTRERHSGHGDGWLLGRRSAPTADELAESVESGQLRFVIVGGRGGIRWRRAGQQSDRVGGPGGGGAFVGPGSGGPGFGGDTGVSAWVTANCAVVAAARRRLALRLRAAAGPDPSPSAPGNRAHRSTRSHPLRCRQRDWRRYCATKSRPASSRRHPGACAVHRARERARRRSPGR